MEEDTGSAGFVGQVGRRRRAIRRQQRLSLEDVEERSHGKWSASAIGAYERGYRNLSLGRLRQLADFYNVPISVLVGEVDLRSESTPGATASSNPRISLDLVALEGVADAAPVLRYATSIAMERGDFNGRVITLRRDDLRLLGTMLEQSEADLVEHLTDWGVLYDHDAEPVELRASG